MKQKRLHNILVHVCKDSRFHSSPESSAGFITSHNIRTYGSSDLSRHHICFDLTRALIRVTMFYSIMWLPGDGDHARSG